MQFYLYKPAPCNSTNLHTFNFALAISPEFTNFHPYGLKLAIINSKSEFASGFSSCHKFSFYFQPPIVCPQVGFAFVQVGPLVSSLALLVFLFANRMKSTCFSVLIISSRNLTP